MMKQEKRKHVQIGLGASSIMMIFVVLCMMILSVLSYSKALQKEKIADRSKQVQMAYSKADASIQYVLHEMKHNLPIDDQTKQLFTSFDIQYEIKDDTLILTHVINEHQKLQAIIDTNKQWIIKEYATTGTGA